MDGSVFPGAGGIKKGQMMMGLDRIECKELPDTKGE